jgi:spore germination cell wall hydrolase CwlJ-like protein
MGLMSRTHGLRRWNSAVAIFAAALLVPTALNKAARSALSRAPAIAVRSSVWNVTSLGDPRLPDEEQQGAVSLSPDDARRANMALPLSSDPLVPAAAFRFTGSEADRSSARACLAAAALYEAGDDRVGEQAVAQVVLNRVRHRFYPKTICGVVFQGSGLGTGCQFTFTCDGSLARVPSQDAWRRALAVADAAIAGTVFKPVGTATHYHADWVVPYWRDTLTKIAVIGAHIFYRMKGAAGTAVAFSGAEAPGESLDPRIAALAGVPVVPISPNATASAPPVSVAAASPLPSRPSLAVEGMPMAELGANSVRLMDTRNGAFVLKLDPDAYAGSYAVLAYGLCRDRPHCLVMGWRDEGQVPVQMPDSHSPGPGLSFYYRQDSAVRSTQMWWNCRQTPRAESDQCLPDNDQEHQDRKAA